MSEKILTLENPILEYNKQIKFIWLYLYIPMFCIIFICFFTILIYLK